MLKTNAVTFYIDKNPKVLKFCEIKPSKSHGNYWQKMPENNKFTLLCCTQKSMHQMQEWTCTVYIDGGHDNLLLSLS